jgi:hypothetical protein
MPTFRTKIREVEAFQFNGQPLLEFPPWAQDPRYVAPSGIALYVYTTSGPVRVEKGSWIIRGEKELYPCLNQDFQERYESLCGTEG